MPDTQQGVEQLILVALATIRAPSGKNLVESGLLAEIAGAGATLVVHCRHPGWPTPIRQRVEGEIRSALKSKLTQLEEVQVEWHEVGDASGPGVSAPAQPTGAESFSAKHVVAVGSGKGGVGKSTIAAALAYALRQKGMAVGLMDADVYGPSIPHLLGLDTPPAVSNNRYVPVESDGIKCMSMGFLVPTNKSVIWRGPMLHKAVRDFLFLVDWGPLEYLIVDLPPGTGDVVLSLSQQMPMAGGVIVCTPQDVALLDARKALDMFQTVKIPCRGVVENMSFFDCPHCGSRSEIFSHGGAEKWAREAGVPFLGAVPIDLAIRVSGDQGRLGDCFDAQSSVRETLLSIADRLLDSVHAQATPAAPKLEIVG